MELTVVLNKNNYWQAMQVYIHLRISVIILTGYCGAIHKYGGKNECGFDEIIKFYR